MDQGDSSNSGSLSLVASQSYLSYLSPDSDPYLEDISQPKPDETHVFEPTSSLSTHHSLAYAVCGELTCGVHSCPGCRRSVHTICFRNEGEGFGTPVWCPKCDCKDLSREAEDIRTGVKRNKLKIHERMIQSSAKRFK